MNTSKERRAAHPDLAVRGDAQRTEAGGAIEELPVHTITWPTGILKSL